MATASYSQFILLHPGSKYGPHLDRTGTTYSLSLNGVSHSVAHRSNVLWVEWASEVLMRAENGSLFVAGWKTRLFKLQIHQSHVSSNLTFERILLLIHQLLCRAPIAKKKGFGRKTLPFPCLTAFREDWPMVGGNSSANLRQNLLLLPLVLGESPCLTALKTYLLTDIKCFTVLNGIRCFIFSFLWFPLFVPPRV